MCEFVVNSFPFEIIMMGTAARRAGEPFVQQFLDKHSRSCWRRPPRCALFLRRVTPTRSHFSRADVAFVCAALPAGLISSPRHANAVPLFPGGHRLCWRPHPRYALFLHRTTPIRPEISRADVAFVCAALPATPCFSIGPRQHDRKFPGRTPPLLASPYPLRLVSPSGHANAIPLFPCGRRLCWRPPTRYALFLRLATPTRSDFSRADTAFVGAALPAAPYFFVGPRQRGPTFPG